MGSEKRERQKSARIAKIEEAEREARRARRNRLAIRTAIAAVVIVGGLFVYTLVAGDDGDETAAQDESSTTVTTLEANQCPPNVAEVTSTSVPFTNEELATEVLDRDPPCPEPPPEDTPADAVETETLIEGEGEGAANGQTIVVQYIGLLSDGTVFDESWSRGQPFELALGQGMVIAGWDEGLVGAKVGERRRIVIGSEKAYGANPQPGSPIPPNAPLAFEVDVLDIRDPDPAATPSTAPADASSTTAAPAEQ